MNRSTGGFINGFLGVLIFSGSLPATRLAVMELDPVFLTVARAAIAGALALCLLVVFRERRPQRGDLLSLGFVSLGVVVGFPCCQHSRSSMSPPPTRSCSSGSCRS